VTRRGIHQGPSSSFPRAVIFDFDGTLADAYAGIAASVNHVRAFHGLPPLSEPEVRRHVGRGPAHLIEHTVPGTDVETGVACYRAHHPSVMRSGTRLLPGAGEALTSLRRAGISLAVCSNKPGVFTRDLLDYLGLAPLLDVVIGPEDAPRPKPAPDMLLLALKRLTVATEDALYVGDMTVDIATARAAGVAVWVVPTGSEDQDALAAAGPDRLVLDLNEIRQILGALP
jgi:phosphoglycolate phosphatase